MDQQMVSFRHTPEDDRVAGRMQRERERQAGEQRKEGERRKEDSDSRAFLFLMRLPTRAPS